MQSQPGTAYFGRSWGSYSIEIDSQPANDTIHCMLDVEPIASYRKGEAEEAERGEDDQVHVGVDGVQCA